MTKARDPAAAVEFCLLVECGPLERQAVALVDSLRRFGGDYSAAAVSAVSPRPENRPAAETVAALDALGVSYHACDLPSPEPAYGPSFRVFALDWRARAEGPPVLVQMDSDMLFCAPPDLTLRPGTAAARPVDTAGMCSRGPGHHYEPVWERCAAIAGVTLDDVPFVTPTLGDGPVRASYNGGFVAAWRDSGLYQVTEAIFRRMLAADLRPNPGTDAVIDAGVENVAGRGAEFWGTTQVALSLAAVKCGIAVDLLHDGYNIPIHRTHQAASPPVLLHYHQVFRSDAAGAEFRAGPIFAGLAEDVRAFIAQSMPL